MANIDISDCVVDMLSPVAASLDNKAFMLVNGDGSPAGHIDGAELKAYIQQEKATPSGLPAGFTELEYLESTGTQYIDTGYTRSSGNDYRMVVDLYPSDYNGNQFFYTIGGNVGGYYVGIYNGHIAMMTSELPTTGRMVLTLTTDNINCTLSDGTNLATYERSSANYSGKVILFARQSDRYLGRCKIYSVLLYKNNALEMNLIPAMRSSTGEVGMFDLITGAFLTNAGTGEFTYDEL